MTQEIPAGPLTIVAVEVDSFQRLRAARLTPSPTGLVLVQGRNGQGKSSLLGAMLEGLGVERSKLPITEGEDGARELLDLGEIKIETRWARKSDGAAQRETVVRAADGSKLRSPAAVLESLRGRFADPVAFQRMKPADQVRTVLEVLGLAEPLAKLESMAEDLFEVRADANREATRLEAAAEELRKASAASPPPEEEPPPLDELSEALRAAQANNVRIDTLDSMLTHIESRGGSNAADIQELERQLIEKREMRRRLLKEHATATTERIELTPCDTHGIALAISEREEIMEAVRLRDQAEAATSEANFARRAHAHADERLGLQRTTIANALKEAQFPIEGMTYDAEGKRLLLCGIPLTQASQAEQLRVAVAIAMAGNPPIRVMFARDGSLLDAESQLILANACEEKGWQLWLEVVAEEAGGAGVWIDDGEAIDVIPAEDPLSAPSLRALGKMKG